MTHPLVVQLRFARYELARGLEGVSPEDALKRLGPMNSISWILGHLANHEDHYWNVVARGFSAVPGLNERVGYRQPASTPALDEMWGAWRKATAESDPYLDTLTPELLQTFLQFRGKPRPESIGTMLYRTIYHYWFHLGEALAIRQMLGHTHLPEFVGEMSTAVYTPE